MDVQPPTTHSPLRLDLEAAGISPAVRFMAVAAFVFGGGGLAAGYDILFVPHNDPIPRLFFFMLPLPFIVLGIALFVATLTFFLRRITLIADLSGLTRISNIFLFRRQRRFPRPPLTDIVFDFASGSSDALSLSKIHLAFDDGRRLLLFQRYGAQETRRLYEALHAAIFPDAEADPTAPPPGGALTVTADSAAFRIRLGSEPARRIGANSLIVSIVLLVFSTLFVASFIIIVWQVDHTISGRALATSVGSVIWMMFVIVCSTLIVKTRRRAREQANITLDADNLRIDIADVSASRSFAWNRRDIRAISVDPSGLRINEQPVFELHITADNSPKPVRLFTGRDIRDLRWLAETLTRRLTLPDPVHQRQQLLEHLDSPLAASTLAAIDHKICFSNWGRVPSGQALILELPPSVMRGFGFYVFAGIWLLFSGAFIVLSLIPSTKTPLYVLPITVAFSIPGIVLACVAYRMTKGTARVALTAATLTIRWRMVRSNEVAIPCDQITGVGIAYGAPDGPMYLFVDRKDGRQNVPASFSNEDQESLVELLSLALALKPTR